MRKRPLVDVLNATTVAILEPMDRIEAHMADERRHAFISRGERLWINGKPASPLTRPCARVFLAGVGCGRRSYQVHE
jgi:hypothetical protein